MMSDRIKPTPTGEDPSQFYDQHDWQTGEIITEGKLDNIEEWVASNSDELLEARIGASFNKRDAIWETKRWPTIGNRFNDLSNYLRSVEAFASREKIVGTLDGFEERITNLDEAIVAIEDWIDEIQFYPLYVTLEIPVNNWNLVNGQYKYVYSNNKITIKHHPQVDFIGNSYYRLKADLEVETSAGAITFYTSIIPAGKIHLKLILQQVEVI